MPPNPALWQRLRSLPTRHLVIETAFSDDEARLASLSRHLHPAALAAELAQLTQAAELHVTHIKPGELPAVMAQVQAHLAGAAVAGGSAAGGGRPDAAGTTGQGGSAAGAGPRGPRIQALAAGQRIALD